MDSYEGQRIYNVNQFLGTDDERLPSFSKDEVLKAFKLFIREFSISGVYIYRYLI